MLALSTWIEVSLYVLAFLVALYIAMFVARRGLLWLAHRIAKRTKFEWDNILLDAKALYWPSYLLPLIVIHVCKTWILIPGDVVFLGFGGEELTEQAQALISNLSSAAMVLIAMLTLSALIDGGHDLYERREEAKQRPIKGYLQIAKIALFTTGTLVAISVSLGRDPTGLLTGLGAMTAVLMLVFKDTILSLVASIQISSTDMVRLGDWIEMPSCNADGDVLDIALHTVRIQNFDKTITTVPTSKLITNSFKNWRGMQESGGRRIKRRVHIDKTSVRFLDDKDVERLSKISLLSTYLEDKKRELKTHNDTHCKDATVAANMRRLTNLGTFRKYIEEYLKHHEGIHPGMTFLIRQIQPTDLGLPIEIYVFTKTTAWGEYEAIQADIFDHLFAIVHEFDLHLFQHPIGHDFVVEKEA